MTPQGWRFFVFLVAAAAEVTLAQGAGDGMSDPFARQREEFRLAYDLSLAGQASAHPDSATLRSYPLYPYLQAQRIAGALANETSAWAAADEEARRFLESHEPEPVGRIVRGAWLSSLAQREQWETYLDQYREDVVDAKLRCLYLAARIELEKLNGIAPVIVGMWLTARQLPIECEPVFTWLRNEGPLTDELIERRVSLLLENGQAEFARIIARRLPENRAVPLLHWADLVDDPAAAIDAHIAMLTEDVESVALLDGWARLSRNEPTAALERFDELIAARRFDREQASPFALALALGLAWDRRPEALDLFGLVEAADLDDYALEWRTRAALWAGDWGLVDESIAAMSAPQQAAAVWRYWAARAAETRRERQRAKELYQSVLGDDNYYSAMAGARLRTRVQPHTQSLPLDSVRVAGLAAGTAFLRARELFLCELRVDAMREWRYGVAQLDSDTHRQSIHLAANWRWYDLAVATATQHGVFNDYRLLYPKPFDDEVLAAARFTSLDREVIYGVIRQESLYRHDAVSASGARGLMQLMPGTAERIARQLGDTAWDNTDLFDPAMNVRLGAAELERLIERYGGQLAVALAAYNAGPNAADRWLPEEPLEADIWIENIPYNETRAYVRRVLWNTVVFRWLETGRAQNTRPWARQISR